MNDTTRQLAHSLKVRHFDNAESFLEHYGRKNYNEFGGMIPIVKAFLEELEEKE